MKSLRITTATACVLGALVAAPVVNLPGQKSGPVSASMAFTPLASSAVNTPSDVEAGTDTREVTPEGSFTAAGIVWDSPEEAGSVEVRIQNTDGSWEPWETLEPTDDGPDPGTAEAKQARTGTEPLHVAEGAKVQVRVPESEKSVLDEAELVTVDPGESAADGKSQPNVLGSAEGATPMPHVVRRAEWGANESYRNCGPSYSSTIEAVTLHHTAGSNNYTKATAAQKLRADYAYHTNALKWCDIGYNALVDQFGTIYEGRYGGLDKAVSGAHAAGFNDKTWGIAMLGDNSAKTPSANQQESIAQLMAWKLTSYNRKPNSNAVLVSAGTGGTNNKYPRGTKVTRPRIFGHRDVGSTSCPGNAGYKVLATIRNRATALANNTEPSKVMKRWQELGGESGYFGKLVAAEKQVKGGSYARFERGAIMVTPGGQVRTVFGGIGARYFAWGGPEGGLGYPVNEEHDLPGGGGRIQDFEGSWGSVVWSEKTGPQAIFGGIRAHWQHAGASAGQLGFPVGEESNIPDYVGAGRVQRFQNGDVYWGPRVGTFTVNGPVSEAVSDVGGARVVGMPMSAARPFRVGEGQRFEIANSWVYGSPSTGYEVVYGAIRATYAAMQGPEGPLGLPVAPERAVAGGRAQQFQHGELFWNSSNGVVSHR